MFEANAENLRAPPAAASQGFEAPKETCCLIRHEQPARLPTSSPFLSCACLDASAHYVISLGLGATDREEFPDRIWDSNPEPVDPTHVHATVNDQHADHQDLNHGQAFVSLQDLELVDVPHHHIRALSPSSACVALRNSDCRSNSNYATTLRPAQFSTNPENISFLNSSEDCVLPVDLADNFYQSTHDQYTGGKAPSLVDVDSAQSENNRHAATSHRHHQDSVGLPQQELDGTIPHDADAISHHLRKHECRSAWDSIQYVSPPGQDLVDGIYFPHQWEDMIPPSGLDGGPAFKKRARARGRESVFENWLRENGLTSYPNGQQLKELAVAEGKTLKQARVALSNLRARLKLRECQDPAHVAMLGSVSYSIGHYAQASHTPNFSSSPTQSHYVSPLGSGDQTALSGSFDIWSLIPECKSIVISNKSSPATCDEQSSALDLPYDPPHEQQQEVIKRKGKRRYAARYNSHTSIADQSGSLQGSDKMFACTSCPESFRRAFDWQRHEEGAHKFNHIEWVCPYHDMSLVNMRCIFCSHDVESIEHFSNAHNVHVCSVPGDIESRSPLGSASKRLGLHVCSGQSVADRTFTRKDLLAQHVRGIHLRFAEQTVTNVFRVPDAWSKEVEPERINRDALWCGFCLRWFFRIPDRMAHVADHFRDGFTIDGWVPRNVF